MKLLKKGLIVSCQAEEGSPFNSAPLIAAFAKAAELGGAIGVRIRDVENVKAASLSVELPIIALTKGHFDSGKVLITPTLDDVLKLVDAGATLIAVDATPRRRPSGMSGVEFLHQVKSKISNPVVADISNLQEGLAAVEEGADFVATTLSGYVEETLEPPEEPDFEIIKQITAKTKTPVIAEGRIWTPEQARLAIQSGAYAVCVGTAITRPIAIVEKFATALLK